MICAQRGKNIRHQASSEQWDFQNEGHEGGFWTLEERKGDVSVTYQVAVPAENT